MNPILIINKRQFGYHTDAHAISVNLAKSRHTRFICFNSGYAKVDAQGVSVRYVSRRGGILIRGFRFIFVSLLEAIRFENIVYVYYFPLCAIIGVFTRNNVIDIRTGSIRENEFNRFIENTLLKLETTVFNRISIISDGLKIQLGLRDTSYILPLGSNIYATNKKLYDNPRLFYIGTLNGRRLEDTLIGLRLFLNHYKSDSSLVTYDIVGDGYHKELSKLKNLVRELELEDVVTFHGRKRHRECMDLLKKCNIGVSYIPVIECYDNQPPTKTFEYILAGMICLATETQANAELISRCNGILHEDNPEAFARALEKWDNRKEAFDTDIIRESLINYSWINITNDLIDWLDD